MDGNRVHPLELEAQSYGILPVDEDTGDDLAPGGNSNTDIEMGHVKQPNTTPRLAIVESVKKKRHVVEDDWDVFLSYRVDADSEETEQLFWQLKATDVVDHGSTRKMKVFWDRGETLPQLCTSCSGACSQYLLLAPKLTWAEGCLCCMYNPIQI